MAQDTNYILKNGLNLVNIADTLYNESPNYNAQSAYIDAIFFIIGCKKNHTNSLEPVFEELDFWIKHYITDREIARTGFNKIQFVKLLIICLTKILEIIKLTNDEDKIDILYIKCISFFQTVLPKNCLSSMENGKLIGDFIPFEGSEELFLGHTYMKLLIDYAITLQIQEIKHTTSLSNIDIVESFYSKNKMNLDLKYAQACVCRGIVLMSLASYNDVLDSLTTALSVRINNLDRGDLEIAIVYRLIAEYYLVKYKYNDAFDSITKCLEIEQNKYIEGNDNYYLITTTFHIKARILLGLAQYKEAYDLSLYILRIREAKYGLRHIEVSLIRLLIADVLQAQGFPIKAYKSYNYAHIIITDCIAERSYNNGNYRSLSLNRFFAYSVYCLAANTEARGLLQEAIILYDSSVELRINIKNGLPIITSIKSTSMVSKKDNNCDLDIAESQIGLARIYCYLGRYTEATELLGQAGSTICKILGNDNLKVSDCLLGIADVFKCKGNYKSAKSQYNQCLNLRSKHLEDNHPLICQVLHSASENFRIPGLFKEAAAFCDKALSGRVQVLGQFHPDTSLSIGLRCRIMCDLNDAEQALPLFYTSFHNLVERLGDSHPHILNFLLDIGECLRLTGSYKDSEEILRDALPLLRKIFKSTTALGGSIDDIIRFSLGVRRIDTDNMEEGLTPDNVLSSIFFFPSMISNEEMNGHSEPLSLSVGQYFSHIGLLLLDQGRAELAREAFSKHAIPLLKQAVGKKHPIVIMADGILGRIINTLAYGLGDIKINRAITKLSKYEECPFPPTHPWIKLLNAPLVVSKVVVLRKEELEEDLKKTGRKLKEHELKDDNIEEWEKKQVIRNISLQKKESEDRAYGYRRAAEEKQKKIDEEIRHQAQIIEIGIECRIVSEQCLTEISYMIQLDYEKEQRLLGQANALSRYKSSNNSIITIDSTESQKRIVLLQKKIELHNVVKLKKIKKAKVFARLYKDQIIQDPPFVYEKPVIDNIDNINQNDDDIFSYARVGDVKNLIRLLDQDPNLSLATDWGGTSVLHMAMILRNFDCVEKLIEYGALVEQADAINRTPLDYIKDLKKAEEIKLFDENLKNNYKEVIPYKTQRFNHFRDACYYGNMEQVKFFLKVDPSLATECDYKKQTGLMFACIAGHMDISRVLIMAGARVNDVSTEGGRALRFIGNLEIKKELGEFAYWQSLLGQAKISMLNDDLAFKRTKVVEIEIEKAKEIEIVKELAIVEAEKHVVILHNHYNVIAKELVVIGFERATQWLVNEILRLEAEAAERERLRLKKLKEEAEEAELQRKAIAWAAAREKKRLKREALELKRKLAEEERIRLAEIAAAEKAEQERLYAERFEKWKQDNKDAEKKANLEWALLQAEIRQKEMEEFARGKGKRIYSLKRMRTSLKKHMT